MSRFPTLGTTLDASDLAMLALIKQFHCPHCNRGASLAQLGDAIRRHRMTARDRRDRLMQLGYVERVGGYHGYPKLTEKGKSALEDCANAQVP